MNAGFLPSTVPKHPAIRLWYLCQKVPFRGISAVPRGWGWCRGFADLSSSHHRWCRASYRHLVKSRLESWWNGPNLQLDSQRKKTYEDGSRTLRCVGELSLLQWHIGVTDTAMHICHLKSIDPSTFRLDFRIFNCLCTGKYLTPRYIYYVHVYIYNIYIYCDIFFLWRAYYIYRRWWSISWTPQESAKLFGFFFSRLSRVKWGYLYYQDGCFQK